jgi:hypothetical protein
MNRTERGPGAHGIRLEKAACLTIVPIVAICTPNWVPGCVGVGGPTRANGHRLWKKDRHHRRGASCVPVTAPTTRASSTTNRKLNSSPGHTLSPTLSRTTSSRRGELRPGHLLGSMPGQVAGDRCTCGSVGREAQETSEPSLPTPGVPGLSCPVPGSTPARRVHCCVLAWSIVSSVRSPSPSSPGSRSTTVTIPVVK